MKKCVYIISNLCKKWYYKKKIVKNKPSLIVLSYIDIFLINRIYFTIKLK